MSDDITAVVAPGLHVENFLEFKNVGHALSVRTWLFNMSGFFCHWVCASSAQRLPVRGGWITSEL